MVNAPTTTSRALVALPKGEPRAVARRRKAAVVARVAIIDPRKLAALRTAQHLGAALAVHFDGYHVTITAEHR